MTISQPKIIFSFNVKTKNVYVFLNQTIWQHFIPSVTVSLFILNGDQNETQRFQNSM